MQLQEEANRSGRLSELLAATESQSEERAATIGSLKQQVDHLRQEVRAVRRGWCGSDGRAETLRN